MRRDQKTPLSQFKYVLRGKGVTPQIIRMFQKIIYEHYRKNPRKLPWRRTRDPYRILVSEIMLQQTQVERVLEKYRLFIKTFPDFTSLAKAQLKDILRVWQGLGYNRRALSLKKIAEVVKNDFGGNISFSHKDLIKLPGIGYYTASAISTFAFNKPALFIETNIRRVFIHFFFYDRDKVRDTEIIPLIKKTIDSANPRVWYYALMDYGVMLKKTHNNPNMRSAHYQRQSPFNGSNRQVRGMILRTLVSNPVLSQKEILRKLKIKPETVEKSLNQLLEEGFLKKAGSKFVIA